MTISEIRKLLKQYLDGYLKEFDFSVIKGSAGGFGLLHDNADIKLTVLFDCLERPEGKELGGGALRITFLAVEKIVFPLVLKHKLWDTATEPTEMSITFGSYDNSEEAIKQRTTLTSVHISNEEDVVKYVQVLKNYLEKVAFPWFQKYSKLEAVNEFINSMDDFESGQYFAPPHMLRKLVIKKLCNDASYGNYLSFWKERFESAKDLESGKYLPYLNAVLDLEEILKN